jgi:penicillin-insensitive murein endopeptidase
LSRASAAACLALLSGVASAGCVGTPTPLAPNLSGSVGSPQHGVQTGAVELPESGPGFARYRKTGGYYWGQPNLVDAVAAAARRVAERVPGGAALSIGDLSAERGGRIERHATHRSGRDVDLLWYATTPEGAPVDNPYFVQMGADGLGKVPGAERYVRLDVAREWLLIESLLRSDHIEVQWMFASRAVTALLVHYALDAGADAELVWRAEHVLIEPVDSLPHDDHLHLRIACSPEASVRGCEGGGPYWEWLPARPELANLDGSDLAGSDLESMDTWAAFEDGPTPPANGTRANARLDVALGPGSPE